MKNTGLILIPAILLWANISLLAQAKVTTMEIEKQGHDAVMIQIDHPSGMTEDALDMRLKNAGLKGSSKRGIKFYKESVLSEISNEKLDIYTKVEKDSKSSSIIYITVSRGYDNFIKSEADKQLTAGIISFLNSMVNFVYNYSLEKDISKLQESMEDSKREYQRLTDEQKDLEKKRNNIESDIKNVSGKIESKREEIDKWQSEINKLKNRRR